MARSSVRSIHTAPLWAPTELKPFLPGLHALLLLFHPTRLACKLLSRPHSWIFLRPTLVIYVLPPTGSLFCDQADRKRQVVLWFPPTFLYKPELSVKQIALLPSSWWFLVCLILWTWRCRWHVPLKHLLTFNGLRGIMSQKIEPPLSTLLLNKPL
jgi:hypothetical protein